MVAVHLPKRNLAAVVAPQDIALAIAVEVADSNDVVLSGDSCYRRVGDDLITIHLQKDDLSAVVAEQDITLTIENAESRDFISCGRVPFPLFERRHS